MKRLIFSIYFLSLILLIGCGEDRKADGTADAGGGDIIKSSEAEVREAIPRAFDILMNPNFFKELQLSSEKKKAEGTLTDKKDSIEVPLNILMNPLAAYREGYQAIFGKKKVLAEKPDATDDLRDYIDYTQIKIKEKGPCVAIDKENADASVSVFQLDAEICLSLEKLKLIPRDSLTAYVASILAHEMTHMVGYGEATALVMQKAVLLATQRLDSSSGDGIPSRLRRILLKIMSDMDRVLYYLEAIEKFKNPSFENTATRNTIRILGELHGSCDSFLVVFIEKTSFHQVFYIPQAQKTEERIVDHMTTFCEAIESTQYTPVTTILKPEFHQKIKNLESLLEESYNLMGLLSL